MITCLNIGYNGRFGNQIFQFAALLGISDKLGLVPKIPKRNLTSHLSQRLMNGHVFNARFELCDLFEIDQKFFDDYIQINQTIEERHFHFDENLFCISDFTNINGYFQTDKYFSHCQDLIKQQLKIKDDFINKAKSLLPKTDKQLVSIHIRRGDYATPNPYHPLNGEEYVNSALEKFKGGGFHFVVISDDKNWCKDVWGQNSNFTILESDSSFIDFTTMTLCDHHIISNSSFSWWASYLSKNHNKKIIAPKNWFGPGLSQNNTCDLYTKNMIVI